MPAGKRTGAVNLGDVVADLQETISNLRSRGAELESALVEETHNKETAISLHRDAVKLMQESDAERDRYREALVIYGKHSVGCMYWNSVNKGACGCGLDAALETR